MSIQTLKAADNTFVIIFLIFKYNKACYFLCLLALRSKGLDEPAQIYTDNLTRTFTAQTQSTGHYSLFVCFLAFSPKSTAMVMAGRSVHLTTLFFWAGLNKLLTSNLCTYFRL